ncbi:hypothetical protein ACXO2T_07980 [Lactobacillus delbrueckii subsp. bulgaricus]
MPDISYIAKLAVLYDVSADYLLKDDKQEGQTIEPGEEMDRPLVHQLGPLYFRRRHLAHRGWFSLDQFD